MVQWSGGGGSRGRPRAPTSWLATVRGGLQRSCGEGDSIGGGGVVAGDPAGEKGTRRDGGLRDTGAGKEGEEAARQGAMRGWRGKGREEGLLALGRKKRGCCAWRSSSGERRRGAQAGGGGEEEEVFVV